MRRLLVIALGLALFASSAFAEGETKRRVVPKEWTVEPKAFYGRVATFLGIEQRIGEAVGERFVNDGVTPREGVLLMLFAHKQTQRLQREQKITTKNDAERSFQDGVTEFLATRKASSQWREVISKKLEVSLHDLTKQADDTVAEAVRSASRAGGSVQSVMTATPKEVRDDLREILLKRLALRPEALKQAWGAVEPVAGPTERVGLLLLVLAKVKTDRLIELGAAAPADKEKVFFESLADFMGQMQADPFMGWGSLGNQVGLHSVDLQAEARSIYDAVERRQAEREQATGRREEPAVPVELTRW